MIIYKPRERFGAFAIFAKALDKPFFAYYNENAVKMRQISTKSMNTVRRGRKLSYAVGRTKVRAKMRKVRCKSVATAIAVNCRKRAQKSECSSSRAVKPSRVNWGRGAALAAEFRRCHHRSTPLPSVNLTVGSVLLHRFVRKNEKRKKQ